MKMADISRERHPTPARLQYRMWCEASKAVVLTTGLSEAMPHKLSPEKQLDFQVERVFSSLYLYC